MRKLSDDELRILNNMKASLGGKIPSAIYVRRSKEDHSHEALNVQVEDCKKLIEANEDYFELVDIYQEDDASGKDIKGRAEFTRLLGDVDEGKIKVIISSKWDRISRSNQDVITLRNSLPTNGVLLIILDDTGRQDAMSTLMRDITGSISQFYLHRISEDTKAVLINKASKGQSAGGRANFGYETYKNQDGEIRLRQNPLEAPIVKEIFERFNMGWSYQSIIDDFKKRNITTRDGNLFTRSTISDILRNVKYCGIYRYNRQDRKQTTLSAKHFDEVWAEGGIEDPIVTKDTFDRVQTKLKTSVGQKKESDYILTNLLECGKCGAKMVGSSQSRGKGNPRLKYYICPNNQTRKGKTCSEKGIAAEHIEKFVEDSVIKVAKGYIKSAHFDDQKLNEISLNERARVKSLNTTIKNHETAKDKILALLLDDPSDKHKKALNQKLEETQTIIDNLEEAVEDINQEIEAIDEITTAFKASKLTHDKLFPTTSIKKRIIHAFVDKVVLDDDVIIDILEED